MASKSRTIRMKHPNGGGKVIPTELEDQFRGRGWKQDTGTSAAPRKRTAKKSATPRKRTVKNASTPTQSD